MTDIFQLHLHLLYIEPTIWRRVQVPATFDLSNLHMLIQVLIGWQNAHLSEFEAPDGQQYSPFPDEVNEDLWEGETEAIDVASVALHEVFPETGSRLLYRYDFGDGWEVIIEREEILGPRDEILYPRLIAGEMAGPPEDCGGPGGYEDLVKIMANPRDPEYLSLRKWLGRDFDPRNFDVKKVQAKMDLIRSGDPEIMIHVAELLPEGWEKMDPKELESIARPLIEQISLEMNSPEYEIPYLPPPDLDGLDSEAFHRLIIEPFDAGTALFQFDLPEPLLARSPLFRLMRLIMVHLKEHGPIKLTSTGNLPVKHCKEFYEQVWSIEELAKANFKKPRIETDYENLFIGRHTLQLAGLTKVRTGKLSLTQKGEKLLTQGRHQELFQLCLQAFCEKFNWGCFDGFGESPLGQMGFAFTLRLLKRYGEEDRPPGFYAQKYLDAFLQFFQSPVLNMYYQPLQPPAMQQAFIARNFYRNLPAWGLVEIIGSTHLFNGKFSVKKTALLDALIKG